MMMMRMMIYSLVSDDRNKLLSSIKSKNIQSSVFLMMLMLPILEMLEDDEIISLILMYFHLRILYHYLQYYVMMLITSQEPFDYLVSMLENKILLSVFFFFQ